MSEPGRWREDLELARAAALIAGELALRAFGRAQDVTFKTPDQPLTETDLAVDRLLRETLTTARPDYGWLSEETADSEDRLARDRVWIVDPIDGTRSFVAGRPEFAVSIGLAERGESVVGVVYNPAKDEAFLAARGGGATLEVRGTRHTLHVSGPGARPRIVASSGDIRAGRLASLEIEWEIEPLGSTAYKLASVAAGRAAAFATPTRRSEWDVCAGALIVAEAGGRVTDGSGALLHFNQADPEHVGIVAAAGGEHDALVAALRR